MSDETALIKQYGELPGIYARLTASLIRDLMRLKGMTREDAEVEALNMTLKQAGDTIKGMEAIDEMIQQQWSNRAPKGGVR